MKTIKLLIGLLSILPAIYAVFYIVFFFTPYIVKYSDLTDISLYIWALLIIGLIIFYHIIISKSAEISAGLKRRLILKLYIGSFRYFPSYWNNYIWKNSSDNTTNQLL
jgi:hypothetical protein